MHYRVRIYITPEFHPLEGVGVAIASGHPAKAPQTRTDRRGIAKVPKPLATPERLRPIARRGTDTLSITLFNRVGSAVLTRSLDAAKLRGHEITIPLGYDQAVLIGLLMHKGRRSVAEKRSALCDGWNKVAARAGREETLGLCLANEVLGIGARLGNPDSALEKAVAKAVHARFDATLLARVEDLFGKTRETFGPCWPDGCPAAGEPSDWARTLFLDVDSPGASIVKALKSSVPDPRTLVGDPRPGPGLGRAAAISKGCLGQLEEGSLASASADSLARILSGELTELVAPSVNRIEVWARDRWAREDASTGSVVRFGEIHDERLTFAERLLLDDASHTIATDVALDSPECLILEADEQGLQRFFVDVKPGQVVTLKGSGFVAGKARASIRFRRYVESAESELMTFLDTWETQAGFELVELDVHGSSLAPADGVGPESSNDDQILFEWPEAASTPGLYRIEIEFTNESDHHVEVSVDPETCETTLVKDGVVTAQPLHFVVPPDLRTPAVRLRATTVACLDETDPEALIVNLADDTTYHVSGTKAGMKLENPAAGDPADMFSFEEIGESVLREASRRFWDAPDTWQANLQAFPDSALESLPFDEMIATTMTLFEIDSELDQVMIRAALVILLITIIMVTFFVMAALIVILIATGVIAVSSFGAGAALTVIVAAVTAAMSGVFFSAIMALIAAIVAVVPNAEVIAAGATSYTGLELAHRLSPLRIHRVLWASERPDVADASLNVRRVSSSLEDGDYTETFRADNLGGRYDLTAAIHTE